MQANQLVHQPKNKVALTAAMINECQNTKALMELPAIQSNWVATYEKTSGKSDGETRFEAEKILFLQAIAGNKAFEKCDKFSIYSSFIELAISGLTLRDGLSYIIPYGGKAAFMPGWRGRLEQINELPNVIHCHEPQVVYDCDDFEYEKGMKTLIHKHQPGQRTEANKPTHVYFVIEFKHGPECYIMDAQDVLNIRNNYSTSYKTYIAECQRAGKQIGETFKKTINSQRGTFDIDVEPPMWISDEGQAFKKTIVKRVYGTLPKLPKQKWLDEKIAKSPLVNLDADEQKGGTGEELNFDDFAKVPGMDEATNSNSNTYAEFTETPAQNEKAAKGAQTQEAEVIDAEGW